MVTVTPRKTATITNTSRADTIRYRRNIDRNRRSGTVRITHTITATDATVPVAAITLGAIVAHEPLRPSSGAASTMRSGIASSIPAQSTRANAFAISPYR